MDGLESKWMPLLCTPGLANTVEHISRNIESVLTRDYVGLQTILATESGAVSVVGSGPSLKENWKKLRDSDTDIIACNAAFQFLLERGVTPKYFFCFDSDPLMLEFITPVEGVTYLLASRCPPKAFEMLEGYSVVTVHAGGDLHVERLLQQYEKMEPMVIGGSAAVTRAMCMAPVLGYKTVHLWGADGSFADGDTHIRKSTTDEKEMLIKLNNRVFSMAPWMTRQVTDFQTLAPTLRHLGIKLIVHGDGIVPHLARTLGYETDEGLVTYRIKEIAANLKLKARILWQQL